MSNEAADEPGKINFTRDYQDEDRSMLLDIVTNGSPGLLVTIDLLPNGQDLRFKLEPIAVQMDDEMIENILVRALNSLRMGRSQNG